VALTGGGFYAVALWGGIAGNAGVIVVELDGEGVADAMANNFCLMLGN
jgi:hypothetical protein